MPISLLAVAFTVGDPLAPFVVGEEGPGQDSGGDEEEEDFHGVFRISQRGTGGAGEETKLEFWSSNKWANEFRNEPIAVISGQKKGFLHWISLTRRGRFVSLRVHIPAWFLQNCAEPRPENRLYALPFLSTWRNAALAFASAANAGMRVRG
jgi:hypothetical protein